MVAVAKGLQGLGVEHGVQHLEQAIRRDFHDFAVEGVIEDVLVDLELALQPVLGQGVLDDQGDLPAIGFQRRLAQRRQ
ncbi:hypothetical protein D3C77_567530 [compost metagenome]